MYFPKPLKRHGRGNGGNGGEGASGPPNYVGVYFPFSSMFIGEERVWKLFEVSPWMSQWVICTFQGQYYTIN